jgi:hypothetical protein
MGTWGTEADCSKMAKYEKSFTTARWWLALTSIGVPGPSLWHFNVNSLSNSWIHRWWFLASGFVACQGRVQLPDSSVAH